MSHGVHRGSLKIGKYDDREFFINKLINKNKLIKFDLYGMNNVSQSGEMNFYQEYLILQWGLI